MALTNQELLEFIAPYLPYNVQLVCDNIYEGFKCELVISNNTNSLKNGMNINECIANDAKLILRPLSDLTKPCLECGEVPIIKMLNFVLQDIGKFPISCKYFNQTLAYSTLDKEVRYKDEKHHFIFNHKTLRFYLLLFKDLNVVSSFNNLILFQFLYKHHFDIHGLIEQGYAIDINTLKDE